MTTNTNTHTQRPNKSHKQTKSAIPAPVNVQSAHTAKTKTRFISELQEIWDDIEQELPLASDEVLAIDKHMSSMSSNRLAEFLEDIARGKIQQTLQHLPNLDYLLVSFYEGLMQALVLDVTPTEKRELVTRFLNKRRILRITDAITVLQSAYMNGLTDEVTIASDFFTMVLVPLLQNQEVYSRTIRDAGLWADLLNNDDFTSLLLLLDVKKDVLVNLSNLQCSNNTDNETGDGQSAHSSMQATVTTDIENKLDASYRWLDADGYTCLEKWLIANKSERWFDDLTAGEIFEILDAWIATGKFLNPDDPAHILKIEGSIYDTLSRQLNEVEWYYYIKNKLGVGITDEIEMLRQYLIALEMGKSATDIRKVLEKHMFSRFNKTEKVQARLGQGSATPTTSKTYESLSSRQAIENHNDSTEADKELKNMVISELLNAIIQSIETLSAPTTNNDEQTTDILLRIITELFSILSNIDKNLAVQISELIAYKLPDTMDKILSVLWSQIPALMRMYQGFSNAKYKLEHFKDKGCSQVTHTFKLLDRSINQVAIVLDTLLSTPVDSENAFQQLDNHIISSEQLSCFDIITELSNAILVQLAPYRFNNIDCTLSINADDFNPESLM